MQEDDTTAAATRLPLDVIGVIADWLGAMKWQGTCAALSITSRSVHDEIKRILWRFVVYRFNNGESAKKKSSARWRAVFGSQSAEYIRYLTVIPSHLPDFGTVRQPSAWDPPFISLITSNRNQLKACMVAGKDSIVSVNVYDHYRPCTSDLLDLMMSVQYLRKVTADYYLHGRFQLCIKHQADAHDAQTDDETLRKAFEDEAAVVEGMSGIIAFLPFRTAALMLTPQQDSPDNNYISRISVDLFNWQSQVAMRYCGANGEVQEDRLPAKAFLIGVSGALYDQAVAFGRTLNVAYAFRKAFGFFVVSVYTRNRVTPEQAKGFTQIIEQNFLKTSSSFLDKPGGHVIIVDGSKAARQMTERQGVKPASATIAYRRLGSETQPRPGWKPRASSKGAVDYRDWRNPCFWSSNKRTWM